MALTTTPTLLHLISKVLHGIYMRFNRGTYFISKELSLVDLYILLHLVGYCLISWHPLYSLTTVWDPEPCMGCQLISAIALCILYAIAHFTTLYEHCCLCTRIDICI